MATKTKTGVQGDSMGNQVGDRIKSIRKYLKIKQGDFALRLGTSGPTISEIENNKSKPGHDVLYNLNKEYGVNANFLLGGQGPMFLGGEEETAPKEETVKEEPMTDSEREFFYYFRNSSIFKYQILVHSRKIILLERKIFDHDIEDTKSSGDR